jgi:iron(III) transport system substrate-binding protein
MRRKLWLGGLAALLVSGVVAAGCGGSSSDNDSSSGGSGQQISGSITLYTGRAESLVGPLISQFEKETGVKVNARYGGTAEMAALISEEGNASPADVFWPQDPGPLGALSNRFTTLPTDILSEVPDGFKSPEGKWVGVSGRSRVVVYNPERVQPSQLPNSLQGFTDPAWRNRVGWAPSNGSFQIMVTAMRKLMGEDATRNWLNAMKGNGAKVYGNNNAIVQAVAAGEVDAGFVNHYYLHALRRTTPNIKAENFYLNNPNDPGALMMVSGAAVLSSTKNRTAAERFVAYLLSAPAQQYFATQTYEYPLIDRVITAPELTPLDKLVGPKVDFAQLDDLQGTLGMMRQTGVLP